MSINKATSPLRGVLYSAPLFIILLAFFIFPLFSMAQRSLFSDEGLSLQYYRAIVSDMRYLKSFLFTTWLALLSTLAALLLCIPAAFYLEQQPDGNNGNNGKTGRLRQLAAVALTLPLSLPGIVIGFFIIIGFGRTGVVTEWLETITNRRNPQIAFTFWGLLLGYSYFQIPRVMLVLRGAIATIHHDVLQVARTLGASPARVFMRIVIPTLLPAILNAATLSLATAYGAFGTAATLSRGLRVIPLEIATLFTERFQPDKAAALSIMLGVITISLMLLLARAERRIR